MFTQQSAGLSWDRGVKLAAGWTGRPLCPLKTGLLQTGQEGGESAASGMCLAHPVYWALISAIIKSAHLSPQALDPERLGTLLCKGQDSSRS